MYDEQEYRKAKKRVNQKKEFFAHLTTSFVIIITCFIINMMTVPSVNWYKWVILGMGISVGIHFFKVYGIPGIFSPDNAWEEKEIEKELQKKRKQNPRLRLPSGQEEGLDLKELRLEKNQPYDERDLV